MEVEGEEEGEEEKEEQEKEETGHLGFSESLNLQRSLATLANQARFSVWGLSLATAAAGVAATTTGLCSRARISRFLGGKHPLLRSWWDFMVLMWIIVP